MRRLVSFFASILLVAAFAGGTAAAKDIEWCAEDPVFQVLGSNFRLTARVEAPRSQVRGISYDVTLPSDALGDARAHYPARGPIQTNVGFNFTGAASGATSFVVSVELGVDAPPGTVVHLSLSGPSVDETTVSGTVGQMPTLTFHVAKK